MDFFSHPFCLLKLFVYYFSMAVCLLLFQAIFFFTQIVHYCVVVVFVFQIKAQC